MIHWPQLASRSRLRRRQSLDFDFVNSPSGTGNRGGTISLTRATTATYVGSNGLIQTASANAPRFDYDPVTLLCKGFLVESVAKNKLLQSRTLNHASWINTITTVAASAVAAPDGTLGAWDLTSGGPSSRLNQQIVAEATTESYSVWVRRNGANDIFTCIIYNITAGATIAQTNLTFSTGSPSVFVGAGYVNAGPDGWYRVTVSASAGITIGDTLQVYTYAGSSSSVIGDKITAWNAQQETGAKASSDIFTTVATVTRNADVATEATSLFPFNAAAGTLFAQYIQPVNDGATHVVVCIDDGTANERIRITTASGTTTFLVTVGGVDKFSATIASPTAGTSVKVAMTYIAGGGLAYQNGVAATIGTAGTTLPTVTTFRTGNAAGISQLNSTIAKTNYFPFVLATDTVRTITL